MAKNPVLRTIGEYQLERELGRGAFGVVYRARHKGAPQTPLALKVVRGRGDTDRLLLEPAVLSRLNHPGIVGLKDYFLIMLDFGEGPLGVGSQPAMRIS